MAATSSPRAPQNFFQVTLPVDRSKTWDLVSLPPTAISTLDGQTFMKSLPNRSFTTLRTRRNGRSMPYLTAHVRRMVSGFAELTARSSAIKHNDLCRVIRSSVGLAMQCLQPFNELRVLIIIDDVALHIHISPIVQTSPSADGSAGGSGIEVECRGKPRENPSVKNTSWVTQRRWLEDDRQSRFGETILTAAVPNQQPTNGNQSTIALYEGLVTNFFVVTNSLAVQTADASVVLSGTMRTAVLTACAKLGIAVKLQPPLLHEWRSFRAAFITNVLRVVIPVRVMSVAVQHEIEGLPSRIILPSDEEVMRLMDRIRDAVNDILDAESIDTF